MEIDNQKHLNRFNKNPPHPSYIAGFIDGDACCLFKHLTAGIVFVFDDIVYHPQFDDRITVGTYPGIHE